MTDHREPIPENLDLLEGDLEARTFAGRLQSFSSERLHVHAHHQILTVSDGVSLLVEASRRQPLFGTAAAFIPAGLPHRSIVLGREIGFKSLYLARRRFPADQSTIRLFTLSRLSAALLDRLVIRGAADLQHGLNRPCLDLLLPLLREDLARTPATLNMPEPRQELTRRMVEFIEARYDEPLTMADFAAAFPYSARHLARRFAEDLNLSIFAYLRLFRIFMASVLLHDQERSITEVALDCGYSSQSSFFRDFKMVFAQTPKSFRAALSAPRLPHAIDHQSVPSRSAIEL